MKKSKSLMVIVMVVMLLFTSCFITMNKAVYAETTDTTKIVEGNKIDYVGIYGIASNKFEFNSSQMLQVYAKNQTGGNVVLDYRHDITTGEIVSIYDYDTNGKVAQKGIGWSDGVITSDDASTFLALSAGTVVTTEESKTQREKVWENSAKELQYSLADGLNISRDDVVVTVTVTMPKIEKYDIDKITFSVNTTDKYTEEVLAKILQIEQANSKINEEEDNDGVAHHIVSISATTKNNGKWEVVLGNDNNFYFLQTEAPSSEPEPEPEPDPEPDPEIPVVDDKKQEFKTTLEYEATVDDVKGKMDGSTYLPPYFDNDNAKKDSDVIATIKSKTDEEIKSTNNVDLRSDGKPNSEGWYYPDLKDKTEIAKKYEFDDYDNTTDNGMVKETVKLTGAEGGEDTQSPSIKWTFRRKTVTEKENDDGSVTVTITYNLPVDPDSIPTKDDWIPLYDKDGKTIHAIQKTIKKGENYDKDVTVKQNGTDAKVTTHVKKTWPEDKSKAPDLGPQAGAFSVILVIAILGIATFAITRYRKINK